jgi:hypothetical protein
MTRGVGKGLAWYALAGGLWRLAVVAALVWAGFAIARSADTAKPRLDGRPSALRDALGFPWQGFPGVTATERDELHKLIPLDPAIRLSDIRPWTTTPTEPALGSNDVHGNVPLTDALAIVEGIRAHRADPSDQSFDEAKQIAEAKRQLTAAMEAATPAVAWLVHYDRGVVYGWEGNRHRAANEFESAAKRLTPLVQAAEPSDEVRAAAIHAFYAWGGAQIESGPEPAVPNQAIDALRVAVVHATNRFRARNPSAGGQAAAFAEVAPTGLSTRALRNDLLAAYLGAPQYRFCGDEPMRADVCATGGSGRCKYRDERFCKTEGRSLLQAVFESEVKSFTAGKTPEATVWALQNAVEIEAENSLQDEPVVAYNVAKLLHDRKRPDLAYRFMQPIVTRIGRADVTPAMVRLGWVSSILANEKVGALPQLANNEQPSGYRIAYLKLHPPDAKHEPPPFRPLQLEDAQKAKSLDAWLFIRRYRHLLASGDFETFIDEHRKLHELGDASTDFLDKWKSAVVVDFLRRTKAKRESALPATKATIDDFLSRSELFEAEELSAAGLSAPFEWKKLLGLYGLLVAAIFVLLARDFLWRVKAYRSTFVSAYQRERRAKAGR